MNVNYDSDEYRIQLKYFTDYYGSDFKLEQGTEEILRMINMFSVDGTLIDFGSGSNIFFWLMAMKNIDKVICVDQSEEAFYINEQIRNGILIPRSYNYISKMYNRDLSSLYKLEPIYLVEDIFENDLGLKDEYENVSQFGLLGLAQDTEIYKKIFLKLWKYVKKNGVFLGANWLYSNVYAEKKGYSNNYLNCNFIEKLAKEIHGTLVENRMIEIKNDKNYSDVILYAIVRIDDRENEL